MMSQRLMLFQGPFECVIIREGTDVCMINGLRDHTCDC